MRELVKRVANSLGRLGMRVSLRLLEDSQQRRWRGITDLRFTSMPDCLMSLKARGLMPRAAVDIGANIGEWTTLFKTTFPDAQVMMVEPLAQHASILDALTARYPGSVHYTQALCGASTGHTVQFHVVEDGAGSSGSSVLPENSNAPQHAISLPTIRLDDLLSEKRFSADFLKLDVQGYELEVLRGARHTLPSAQAVLLEVSVWQYNVGAPILHEVIDWMRKAGFVAYDICGISRRSTDRVLLQIDVLFVPAESSLLRDAKTIYGKWAE